MALLTLAVAAATYAKTALSPLQEVMRVSLHFSDHQMALLQGPAIALPMVVAGIPLGIAADRMRRTWLLFALMGIATAVTAGMSLISSFAGLFVLRATAGLCVFASFPVAVSLIADFYEEAQRGRATMVLTIGQYAGAAAVFSVAGSILEYFGDWHVAAIWSAAPLGLATLLLLLMREPARRVPARAATSETGAFADLRVHGGSLWPLIAGIVIVEVALGAVLTWSAPLFTRSFAMSAGAVGGLMSGVIISSGVAGALLGGITIDRVQRRTGRRGAFALLTGLSVAATPAGAFALLPNLWASGASLALFLALVGAICVIGTAMITIVVPGTVRGLAAAILSVFGAIFGVALAPLTVTMIAGLIGRGGELGIPLTIVCGGTCLAGATIFASICLKRTEAIHEHA